MMTPLSLLLTSAWAAGPQAATSGLEAGPLVALFALLAGVLALGRRRIWTDDRSRVLETRWRDS